MALKLNERYPGRFYNPSANYPQGSFKNRSTPTAKDGSYLEKDWANDKEGFFQSLLSKAGVTANGLVDTVQSSQYLDALRLIISGAGVVVGLSRNLSALKGAANNSIAFTANDVIVGAASGLTYKISALNRDLYVGAVGAGGMDTGASPVSGYVGIYAIYNPTTGASALLGVNATSAKAPNIYDGANLPAGYTASALISVWPTNASGQLVIGSQREREIYIESKIVLTTSTPRASLTSLSIASAVPPNAVACRGDMTIGSSTASAGTGGVVCGASSEIGRVAIGTTSPTTGATAVISFPDIQLSTQQILFYRASVSAGTLNFVIGLSAYTI